MHSSHSCLHQGMELPGGVKHMADGFGSPPNLNLGILGRYVHHYTTEPVRDEYLPWLILRALRLLMYYINAWLRRFDNALVLLLPKEKNTLKGYYYVVMQCLLVLSTWAQAGLYEHIWWRQVRSPYRHNVSLQPDIDSVSSLTDFSNSGMTFYYTRSQISNPSGFFILKDSRWCVKHFWWQTHRDLTTTYAVALGC